MSNVKAVDTTPEYIDTFIKHNYLKLNQIFDEGLSSNNNEGCLYLQCKKKEDKIDVSFLNKENIQKIITSDTWEGIKETYKGKIFIINEFDDKRIFIVNI